VRAEEAEKRQIDTERTEGRGRYTEKTAERIIYLEEDEGMGDWLSWWPRVGFIISCGPLGHFDARDLYHGFRAAQGSVAAPRCYRTRHLPVPEGGKAARPVAECGWSVVRVRVICE